MSPTTGKLIDDLLKQRGLKHKDLAERTGFEINYVSNVVSKGEASTKFLLLAEKEFELERGSLAQWNLLRAVVKICRKEGISLDEGVSWFGRAAKTFRNAPPGHAVPKAAQNLPDPKGAAPPAQEQPPAQKESMTVRLTKWLAEKKHYVNFGGWRSRATTPFYLRPVLCVFERMTLPHPSNLIYRSA